MMEFRGGTYISQVESIDLESSLEMWACRIIEDIDEMKFLGVKTIEEIKDQLLQSNSTEVPVPLNGLKNIWCLGVSTQQGSGLIHIIKTESD